MTELTPKQAAFVEAYLRTFSASQAAKAAGVSEASCRTSGCEWLALPHIKAVINERMAEKAMQANEVLARLAEQAKCDISDCIDYTEDGDWYISPQKAIEVGKSHLIKSVSISNKGTKITLVDSQKALELIGRHQRLFADVVEAKVQVSEFDGMSDRELDEYRSGKIDLPTP